MPVITVFGSSRPLEGSPQYSLAYEVGEALAHAGFTVCNGGYGGTMTASSRGAKEAGGSTIGVTTAYFSKTPNRWIDTVIVKETMIDRLLELVARGDGYVVLEGGTGTLLELACVWEFMNKSVIATKPIVTVGGFWDGVVETLKGELVYEGLENCTKYVNRVSTAVECVEVLRKIPSTKLCAEIGSGSDGQITNKLQ